MADKYIRLVNGTQEAVTAVVQSQGSGDAGKLAALGSDGKFDSSVIPASVLPTHLTAVPEVSVWGGSTYICPMSVNGTSATTVALTASRTYWYPFVVWKTMTSITLAVNVTTAAAGTHYLGVYASNADGKPTTLVGSGSFDAGTTGVKTVTINATLNPGIYWMAWATGSAATVRASALAGSPSFGLTSSMGTAHITYWYTSGSTLPSTAPTSGYTAVTGAVVPVISVV